MRNYALVVACLLFSLATNSLAAADPLEVLHGSTFTTVAEVTVQLPHGRMLLQHAVVASLPGQTPGTAGLALGEIAVVFDALPSGPGALNLLAELDPAAAGTAAAPLQLQAESLYFSTAADSRVQFGSRADTVAPRMWSQLAASEQAGFEEVYLQAYGDSWVRGHGADFGLRAAQGGELYAAFWVHGPAAAETTAIHAGATSPAGTSPQMPARPQLTRYDYRVLEDGQTMTLEDYARGITLVQAPWAAEEGEHDKNVAISAVSYYYSLTPAADGPGRISGTARVSFDLKAAADSVRFLSAPWFGLPQVDSLSDISTVTRGGPATSDWVLTIAGDFAPGPHYLEFTFPEVDIPQDFRGPGAGGVYRLDTSLLVPSELSTTVALNAWLHADGFTAFGRSPFRLSQPSPEWQEWLETPLQVATSDNPRANRNEMLVLTRFPSQAVPTAWGTLNVTAPAEMLDDTQQLAGVQSLEAMVDYFLRAWGDPRTGAPCPTGVPSTPYTLNVFFIPGESGVQAFEDAGMVFILGGQQSYGGQGGGQLPLIAHEVAHVWWGHGVAAPRWFTEGMANYAAARFVEQYYGEGGPAAGQDDPLSYRRYLINFGLGSSMPVSLERRDQLDDSAAIYHESAGFLLTADNRIEGGLDPVLAGLYAQHVNGPALDHGQLRASLVAMAPAIGPLWDSMVEQGLVETGPDDPTFRELLRSPARENYVALLGWLNPAYRKNAAGDYAGAYYAMSRALDFRSEPKDRLMAAELALKAGRAADARRHADSLAGEALDEGQTARLQAVEAGL